MGGRRIPHRRPLTRPIGVTGIIRTRIDDQHYLVMIGSRVGKPEVAFWSGVSTLTVGDRVQLTWREESRLWFIGGLLRSEGVGAGDSIVLSPAVGGDDGHWSTGASSLFSNSANSVVLGDGGTFFRHSFFRFPNVQADQGITVGTASLLLTFDDTQTSSSHTTNIRAEDVDDAVAPITNAEAQALVLTTASVAWDYTLTGQAAGASHTTSDFAAVLQEIFDRPGWVPNNAVMILIITENGSDTGTSNDSHAAIEDNEQQAVLTFTTTEVAAVGTETILAADVSYTPTTAADWTALP